MSLTILQSISFSIVPAKSLRAETPSYGFHEPIWDSVNQIQNTCKLIELKSWVNSLGPMH